METPPRLPKSFRSRVLTVVVEVLFLAYLAGGLMAVIASALLVARGCRLVFDLWYGFAFVAGLALQGCKLGTLLFAGDADRCLARVAAGLLIALSLVAACAAVAEALHRYGFGAVAVGLLVATALEATMVSIFLSLRRRAEAVLAQGDLLDGVASEAAALFRRQEARHHSLRHDAAGHVRALRTALRADGTPTDQASAPCPNDTPMLDHL